MENLDNLPKKENDPEMWKGSRRKFISTMGKLGTAFWAAQFLNPESSEAKTSPEKALKSFGSAYEYITRNKELEERFLPEDLFSNDFFISIQLTESSFGKNRESHAGAMGIMQVTPVALIDTNEFLNKLKKENIIPHWLPDDISMEEAKKMSKMAKNNDYHGRVTGKLHFANYFDRYNIGKEPYKTGNIREAQKELAVCYNAGQGKGRELLGKSEDQWKSKKGIEAKGYYRKVFNYIDRLAAIRKRFERNELESGTDYCAMLLARRMDDFKDNDKARYKWLDYKMTDLKAAEAKHKKLSDQQLRDIIN